jgi:hypothetical protein
VSASTGGLILPFKLDSNRYSIFSSLWNVFSQGLQFNLLFSPEISPTEAIPPAPLFYFLSYSLWELNFDALNKIAKTETFKRLRNPGLDTNTELHYFREDLEILRDNVIESRRWIPPEVNSWYKIQTHGIEPSYALDKMNPVEAYTEILNNSDRLSTFLLDSLLLLIRQLA